MHQPIQTCPFCDQQVCTCALGEADYQRREAADKAAREAAWQAELARYNALSPEEQEAEDWQRQEDIYANEQPYFDCHPGYAHARRMEDLNRAAEQAHDEAIYQHPMQGPYRYREDGPDEPAYDRRGRLTNRRLIGR